MKILHIVTNDIGGAGRAARRINKALIQCGYDSKVLVMEKYGKHDEDTIPFFSNDIQRFFFKTIRKVCYIVQNHLFERTKFADAIFGLNLSRHPLVKEADVINLHWVGYGFLSYKGIKVLLKTKNVVWTLHDMWAFTAGCFYDGECGKYIKGCHDCNFVEKASSRKLTKLFNSRKINIYKTAKNVVFVGCSNWMTDCAARSMLMTKFHVVTIPNPIDLETFRPVSQSTINVDVDRKKSFYLVRCPQTVTIEKVMIYCNKVLKT